MGKNRITFEMTSQDAVIAMAEGNPGALTALLEVYKIDSIEFIGIMLYLDSSEIYGSDIWVLFAYGCEKNVEKFIKIVKEQPAAAEAYVKEWHIRSGSGQSMKDFILA